MSKKLVAPGITEGEWRCDIADQGDAGGNAYVGLDAPETRQTVARVMCYDPLRNLEKQPYEANARFLAGSKRVAEAAAYALAEFERMNREGGLGIEVHDRIDSRIIELRSALLASGYSEED